MSCAHENICYIAGRNVCTDCGLMFQNEVQYVFSYNHRPAFRHCVPVYSRRKRFYAFLKSLDHPAVSRNVETIMDRYCKIEFHYSIFPTKTRRYFFNKNVILFFIMSLLCLDTDGIRTLKDSGRVNAQTISLQSLVDKIPNFHARIKE